MAAQSGIAPTQELTDLWTTALADPQVRLVKIVIKDEQLVPSGTFTSTSPTSSLGEEDAASDAAFAEDFALFDQDGVVEENVPAYYAYRITAPPASTFAFFSYVPDHAPVRQKMLYASTQNTLVKSLGDSRLPLSIFATSKSDLTHASYLSHIEHSTASAPLTAREAEMASIRAAEASEAASSGGNDTRQGRSMIFGNHDLETGEQGADGEGQNEARGVLPWADEAKEKVRELGESGEPGQSVALEIDISTETVVLSTPQPSSLSLPTSSPCYLFYKHAAGLVLIYSCPPSSPIKSRLIYSSAVLVLYKVALPQFTGQKISKKLETDSPDEVDAAWIDSELGPSVATVSSTPSGTETPATGSGTSTPLQGQKDEGMKFARPARPGRKR
ncbi:RHTO0S06e02740g1_1 [Rhodotorula toruloides]|uniref:RHTO0S06e02740g1_1 n=1 Tax=Rhodotorula toruloides TaxID=5286 RepID=A0A061AWH0_RHOTO|nr:RHTO0S06e02740g1_1 [Rhodotorula toruloides]